MFGDFNKCPGAELKKRGFAYDMVFTLADLNKKMLEYDIIWILSLSNTASIT